MHCAQVSGRAIDLGRLRTPHRVVAINGRLRADAFNPAMHQPRILAGGYVSACMKSTWEEISGTGSPKDWQPGLNGIPRPRRVLELDRSTCPLLGDGCSASHIGSRANFVYLQFDQVVGASLAIDCQRSRLDQAISRRTRMDQTCFGSRGFFWPMSNPLFQDRRP